jgi:uncharacterized protein YbaR (Trm112 family)
MPDALAESLVYGYVRECQEELAQRCARKSFIFYGQDWPCPQVRLAYRIREGFPTMTNAALSEAKPLVHGYLCMEEPAGLAIGLMSKQMVTVCMLNGFQFGSVFIDRGVPDDVFARTGFHQLVGCGAFDTALRRVWCRILIICRHGSLCGML